MTRLGLAARGLTYYWRTNLAVACGVGVAVSALAGALVVGESVRASLRELALSRLGETDTIVTAAGLFTDSLADRLASAPAFRNSWSGPVPVLALEGVLSHQPSGARAGRVQVFGVDDRFWQFNGVEDVAGPAEREAFLSAALARELGAARGDALLLRVQKPSSLPAGIIQGRRSEPGRAIRLSAARILGPEQLGEFSPRPQQGIARTIFVPLERLQRDLELPHRINMMLAGAGNASRVSDRLRAPRNGGPPKPSSEAEDPRLQDLVERTADLTDLGIRLRPLQSPVLVVESDTGLLTARIEEGAAAAARAIGIEPIPVLTYLATSIRANGRDTPYSLVSALPEQAIGSTSIEKPIWLNEWAADDLGATAGDTVTLEYYLWSDADGLTTDSAAFTLAGVLPMDGLAVDADLTPEYPGMSTSANMGDWDPPFPVDLRRIRPKDEDYWDEYRAAPKAFIRLADGQALWQSRYGRVSSLRIPAGGRTMTDLHADYREAIASHVPAAAADFRVIPVRANALAAAAGTTDFGEYFTYFSFFLVVSSLLLALLFFRLGVEGRAREVGLLAALGYTARHIRGLFLAEGALLALAGAAAGVLGALAYSWLMMYALRTWWVDAVGTTALRVHVSVVPLAAGAAAGVAAALVVIAWSLRVLRRSTARQLMSGGWVESTNDTKRTKPAGTTQTAIAGLAAVVLVALGSLDLIPAAAAFFGSGILLLVAGLLALAAWLRSTSRQTLVNSRWAVARLGVRNARYRPSRSVLCVALVAAATFLIVSVGAFRRGAGDPGDAKSSSGGYALIAETVVPLHHDPSTPEGREALNLGRDLEGIDVARFRLRPGDDASCLNLYRPQNPRLLGATDTFIEANRFSFSGSLAGTPEEEANPWRLLHRRFEDGAIPVVGDATSLAYVFHLGIGDDYVMQGPDGAPLRLRIVGALRDSVLQSELVMGDAHFTRLFPRNDGFRVFLVSAAPDRLEAVAAALEDQLEDFGLDVQATADRLASYHRVENTYLSTFQALGALGLILGTLGLGTVLLRNVLERRRELALLRATGYRRSHLVQMVVAESVLLLLCGLVLGVACAAVAIAPAWFERGQPFPVVPTLGLLLAVLVTGLLSTLMATRAVARLPLLEGLRNE